MAGRLIVCPSPIGNIGDVSPRVRQALADADLVACEDTRRAGRLYERLDLDPPRFVSNHDSNEEARAPQLAKAIERGARVALLSDAGTPVLSDPGYRLIRACIERGIEIEVLPGPTAITTALVASGLPADRWRFEGFLPRRAGELERVLQSTETVVAFESPRRLPASLRALAALAPDRPAAVCRELTKLHEEVARGTLGDLARQFRGEVKGEIVVVIAASSKRAAAPDTAFAVDALRRLVQSGARPRAAAQVVAALDRHPSERALPRADRARAAAVSHFPAAPAELGRGVIVAPGAAPPESLGRRRADRARRGRARRARRPSSPASTPSGPERVPVVVELGVDPAGFREPQSVVRAALRARPRPRSAARPAPSPRLGQQLRRPLGRADLVVGGEGGAARRRRRRGCADVALHDGRDAWIDGGPRWSAPETEALVIEASAVEAGLLEPVPRRSAAARGSSSRPTSWPRSPTTAARSGSSRRPARARPGC